ncbi:aminotransferase class V-fold PLP-dependent enzyme [Eubacterium sp.]|uniref:aminotransferase class V-fold PLP-dependent enzyme n=1 Tax=Eubacterium sp. TaxID=142586 RepID=UPI002FC88476
MKSVYFDNASTSWPKAPGVSDAMTDFMENIGCNTGRGTYRRAFSVSRTVYDAREKLCRLFGGEKNSNVVFTANVTESLNMVLKGLLTPGDHVVVTSLCHNAVARPLTSLAAQGVTHSFAHCHQDGHLDLGSLEAAITPQTVAVVLTHGCNVSGSILPLKWVGDICKRHGIFYIVDAAQTAGLIPINVTDAHVDALCFTAHKGLGGPQGIGGFLVSDALARRMTPLLDGGTGSFSDSLSMPEILPDRFEAGTLNLPGIYGLSKALDYLETVGIPKIEKMERLLTSSFLMGLLTIPGLNIIGSLRTENHGPVVSVSCPDQDLSEIATALDRKYGIMTRVGLHCAPLSHQTLGSYPTGSLRFSFNHHNTLEEVAYTLDALRTLLKD